MLDRTSACCIVVVVVANLEYCRHMMRFVVDVDARITFAVPPGDASDQIILALMEDCLGTTIHSQE